MHSLSFPINGIHPLECCVALAYWKWNPAPRSLPSRTGGALSVASDVGEDFDIGGSGVGHLWIEAALLAPELVKAGALSGVESVPHSVDVLLMTVSLVTFRKRILVDAGEQVVAL